MKFFDVKSQEPSELEKKNTNDQHEHSINHKNTERRIESAVKNSKVFPGKLTSYNTNSAMPQNLLFYDNNQDEKKEPERALNNQILKNQQKNIYRKPSNVSLKRPISALSLKSRNVNDSYAYNDVKKYIDENDLMPPEKAEFIKTWINEVNLFIKDLEQTVS